MLALNGHLGRILAGAVFLLPIATAEVQTRGADPGEWRLLSRVQVNPTGAQAFVENFFSYNQLKVDPTGDLVLGFVAFPQKRKSTDVLVSRFDRSVDRWTPSVPIAETKDLERSPAIWIDGQSGAVHAAWVGNERRKSREVRSELRVGYRRSGDRGATWTPPRYFGVGTARARRPQLMGDVEATCTWPYPIAIAGNKSASICFRAPAAAGTGARSTSISLTTGSGGTRDRPSWVSDRMAAPAWFGSTRPRGRRAVVFSKSTGEYTWSMPVRVNDDSSMSCIEPRMAVQGETIYVTWHVVKGDRTTLYVDRSQDGGANWNSDQVIFDRKALSVQASLQPIGGWAHGRMV